MSEPTWQDQDAKWVQQIAAWRRELGAVGSLSDLKPWSRFNPRLLGIPQTRRVMETLDCIAIDMLGGAKAAQHILSKPNAEILVRTALDDCYADVSQNPIRRAYSGSDGILSCLHTGTCLYSFRRDSVIVPFELMLLQGHGLDIRIPSMMRQKQLHDLAGMGMFLPCVACIIVSVMLTVGL